MKKEHKATGYFFTNLIKGFVIATGFIISVSFFILIAHTAYKTETSPQTSDDKLIFSFAPKVASASSISGGKNHQALQLKRTLT